MIAKNKAALALVLLLFSAVLSAKMVIIVNSNAEISQLPKSVAKGIFTGDIKTLKGMDDMIVCLQEDNASHEAFLSEFLGMTGSQFEQLWQKLIFTGKAMEPEKFSSDAEVIKYVIDNPGAIGYINVESLDNRVKALLVK